MFDEIIFFTSSRAKLAHAKYLCRFYNVSVVSFHEKYYRANYEEPRHGDREYILRKSFESASKQAEKAGIYNKQPFIIEDTSVIIEALSQCDEYPGVNVKYWMETTSFHDLDLELNFVGNDRSVRVRSDLLLHIPGGLDDYKHYTSCSFGSVIEQEVNFESNPFYPWLDNKTFNKWFVPCGESSPISCLPIDIANVHDFRKGSFERMLIDLETNGYIRRRSDLELSEVVGAFLGSRLILINGLTCSGKTTAANYFSEEYGYLHVEASDFMHVIFREKFGFDTDVKIGSFSAEILKENPSLVVDSVVDYIKNVRWENVVVTGFRLTEEVDKILHEFRYDFAIDLVYVEASTENRMQRKKLRNRDVSHSAIEELEARDRRELEMGLSKIRSYKQNVLVNDSTISDYLNCLERELNIHRTNYRVSSNGGFSELPLRTLILLCLFKLQHGGEGNRLGYTTAQIAKHIGIFFGVTKSKNNVSRYFNQSIRPLYEISLRNGKKYYAISNTGIGLARVIYRTLNNSS